MRVSVTSKVKLNWTETVLFWRSWRNWMSMLHDIAWIGIGERSDYPSTNQQFVVITRQRIQILYSIQQVIWSWMTFNIELKLVLVQIKWNSFKVRIKQSWTQTYLGYVDVNQRIELADVITHLAWSWPSIISILLFICAKQHTFRWFRFAILWRFII